MSENDKKNQKKLNDEIVKEVEGGMDLSEESAEDDDFTVKVSREQYIVKRRFYDKDMALETAESLRQDKRNLVEDNIDGEILSDITDDDDDVDWDKLVDTGLVFDPPIAEAVEKKPGEKPVGLKKIEPREEVVDDREIEKTLMMKSMPGLEVLQKEASETKSIKSEELPESGVEDSEQVDDVSEVDEDHEELLEAVGEDSEEVEENQDEDADYEADPITSAAGPRRAKEKSSGNGLKLFLAAAVVLIAVAVVLVVFKPFGSKQPPGPDPLDPGRVAMKMPVKEDVSQPVETSPGEADEVTGTDTISKTEDIDNAVKTGGPEPEVAIPSEPVVSDTVAVEEEPVKTEIPVPDVTTFHPYTAHVGSYKKKQGAVRAIASLKKKGFDAFSGFVRIPGKGDWYRVYVGYYPTYKQASASVETIKSKAKEDAYPAKSPWTIQIGSAVTPEDAGAIKEMMASKGYAAYSIPLSDNPPLARVLAGAFKSEAEASAMFEMMQNEGMDVKIVKR